jgi:hypothetical protein
MYFLGVDLAASYSAYCVLEDSGQVCDQGDSWKISDSDFVSRLLRYGADPDCLTVVEDLPHKIIYRVQVKEVCRLQGRIINEYEDRRSVDRLHFIAPATWQLAFGVFRKGVTAALDAAERYGYSPPDLRATDHRFKLDDLHGTARSKLREAAKKIETDYTDAYLIAEWARLTYAENATLDVQGIQRPRFGPAAIG